MTVNAHEHHSQLAQTCNDETQASVLKNRDKVKSIVSQFVASNGTTTAACVSATYYLRSTADYHQCSLGELRQLSGLIYDSACELGRQPHETKTELHDRTESHYLTQVNAWHQSIDAAIWDTRQWLSANQVPQEVLEACHRAGIESQKGMLVVCLCHALQQRCGDNWFISGSALPAQLKAHGLDGIINKRAVHRTIAKLIERQVIRETSPAERRKQCREFVFDCPAPVFRDSICFRRGSLLDFASIGTVSPALLPFYAAGLPFPALEPQSLSALQGITRHALPLSNKTHGGHKLVQQHMGDTSADGRYWDKATVLEATKSKEDQIVKVLTGSDLEPESHRVQRTCPKCQAKKKARWVNNGSLQCFKCHRIGSNVIDVVMQLTGCTFAVALRQVAEHLDLPPTETKTFGLAKAQTASRPAPEIAGAGVEDITEAVAAAHSVTTEALLHYGAKATRNTVRPKSGGVFKNAVVQFPMRDPGMRSTGWFDVGVATKSLLKGLCGSSADGSKMGLFVPNDFDATDGKPVTIYEGLKDAAAAWSDDTSRHHIGLPGGSIPSKLIEAMSCALQGRNVIVWADCDDAGRRAAQTTVESLAKHGVTATLNDADPTRIDGAGYRETSAKCQPVNDLPALEDAPF